MRIGVLALQGGFHEHQVTLENLGLEAQSVKLPLDLENLDGLIIPGGESTTIIKLMLSYCLFDPVRKLALSGFPIWGTCAGLICLARRVLGINGEPFNLKTLAAMNITVKRNAFGNQSQSFETDLHVNEIGTTPFHAIFIRAPLIMSIDPPAIILARLADNTIVAARQGRMLVTAFHPELSNDGRFLEYFVSMIRN
jgi:5'-phosphate synthase pdxT subunit